MCVCVFAAPRAFSHRSGQTLSTVSVSFFLLLLLVSFVSESINAVQLCNWLCSSELKKIASVQLRLLNRRKQILKVGR